MERTVRAILFFVGAVAMILAVGFFIQAPWATALWPLKASRLSAIFLSSIFAASGAPILWIALSGEIRAGVGGALNLGLVNLAAMVYAFQLYQGGGGQPLLLFAIGAGMGLIACAAIFLYARRFPFRDPRPTPRPVRAAFAVFSLILALAGGALAIQRPNVFPWPLSPETSTFYGWIFLGAMCYFLYGLVRPVWANARGQLLGFLAYDLVLIVPFLLHFQAVQPNLRLSLALYTAVLILSGTLAVYYLFIHRATRFHRARKGEAAVAVPS